MIPGDKNLAPIPRGAFDVREGRRCSRCWMRDHRHHRYRQTRLGYHVEQSAARLPKQSVAELSSTARCFLLRSAQRDIAPIFAMHCNRCTATRDLRRPGTTYPTPADEFLRNFPGYPYGSQVVQFIEEGAGKSIAMPLRDAVDGRPYWTHPRWIAEVAPKT